MYRFQLDRPLMRRRWREEWLAHGRDFGNCHCGLGPGTMRKHRPQESHPSSSCGGCALVRALVKWESRRDRRAARAAILQGLADAIDDPHNSGEPELRGATGYGYRQYKQ